MLVVFATIAGMVFLLQAYTQLSFVAVQTAKQALVPLVAIGGVFFRTEVFSPTGLFAAVTILAGVVMLAIDHNLTWGNFLGFAPLAVCGLAECVRLIGSQYLLQQLGG